jgi:hypothetical protein
MRLDLQSGRFTADPDDARPGSVAGDPMKGDFIDQATQERFRPTAPLIIAEGVSFSDFW